MALAVALALVGVAVVVLWLAVGREPGPTASDAATAYELAWHRHDFDTLFDLSDPTLRDGMGREAFIAARAAAFAGHRGVTEPIDVCVESAEETGGQACVVTRVSSAGDDVRNELRLVRRHRRWSVASYALRPEPSA